MIFGEDSPCFGCAPHHPVGLRLTFDKSDEEVVTRYLPPERFQGPPGIMHGGLVSTLADEIGAWTVVAFKQRFGFTAAMDLRFKAPVRIGREVVGRGRLIEDRSRIVKVEVTLEQDEVLALTGTFTFAVYDVAGAERLLGTELPEAWRRFGRP